MPQSTIQNDHAMMSQQSLSTDMKPTPRYPIYVISKGRADIALTPRFLERDGVPFSLVVEPQEYEAYRAHWPNANILVLPFSNLGQGGIPARNWCWEHAKENGHARHWILDDNIAVVRRQYRGKRITSNSAYAFAIIEDFVDRYTNIAISGMNYENFVVGDNTKPYILNARVYSCLLIDNSLDFRWRGRYNEDTDLSIQVLSAGYCTVLFNLFMIHKTRTMVMKGGNTDELYQGDGRLRMAKSLERQWPYVVETKRRFKRPQHVVKGAWRGFDTPLKRREDLDWDNLKVNDYGMKLIQVRDDIKSPRVRKLIENQDK